MDLPTRFINLIAQKTYRHLQLIKSKAVNLRPKYPNNLLAIHTFRMHFNPINSTNANFRIEIKSNELALIPIVGMKILAEDN